jgi:antitoxin ParD1/3/4
MDGIARCYMGKNTSVVLGPAHEEFVRRQIERGRFGSASEAVREGLTLLEMRELAIERLRQAIDEGDASGDFQEIDMKAWLAERP